MKFDDEGNITIRQSWLDTAMRCGERGRFAVVKPEWDSKSSDSAIIGTVAHAGIEAHIDLLNGRPSMSVQEAMDEALRLETLDGVKWTKYATALELRANAQRCYEAWVEGILPTLQERNLIEGARTEVNFTFPLYRMKSGRLVSLTGTVDLVPQGVNLLVDWKTASQKFRGHEKQKYAIQPTVYALAAVRGALAAPDDPNPFAYRWPVDFLYGVMVRGQSHATPQLLTVRRTEEHALFAIERIKQYVDMALDFGLDKPWPRNDDHFLCSATWCPWWSICKGAHAIDDTRPDDE